MGLNLYVTWFLLLAAEQLSGRRCKTWRRGLAALAGGLSSLAIFLPELPFGVLFCLKAGLAAGITAIAGGRESFLRRTAFFLGANFLFAGVMIALWLLAAPPRLVIRNGCVYYHIPAMTLAVSTILAYGAARLLVWLRRRGTTDVERAAVRVGLNGREAVLEVFHDSGNRLRGIGGTPVVVCDPKALEGLVPPELAAALRHPGQPAGGEWGKRVQLVPCETVSGSGLLAAFTPDFFRAGPDGGEVRCLLAVSREPLHGDFQAVAGDEIFAQLSLRGKEGDHAGKMEKPRGSGAAVAAAKARAASPLRLHKRRAEPPASADAGGGTAGARPPAK